LIWSRESRGPQKIANPSHADTVVQRTDKWKSQFGKVMVSTWEHVQILLGFLELTAVTVPLSKIVFSTDNAIDFGLAGLDFDV